MAVLSDTGPFWLLRRGHSFQFRVWGPKPWVKLICPLGTTPESTRLTLKPWVLAFHQADAHIRRGMNTLQNCQCCTEGKTCCNVKNNTFWIRIWHYWLSVYYTDFFCCRPTITQIFLYGYCSCKVLLLDVSISFPQHLHLHRAVYVFFLFFHSCMLFQTSTLEITLFSEAQHFTHKWN